MPDSVANTPAPNDGEGLAQRLLDQLDALSKRVDKAERRVRIERALADAQAADIQAAADEIEHEAQTEADLGALVRRLKRSKPGLFRSAGEAPSAAGLPAPSSPRADQGLVVLREKARQGDRASLLLYLRARREKA